jgi:putative endonuclease
MSYLYILQSLKNNTYYIGSTRNIENRLKRHFQGKSKYTKNLLPLKLVFKQKFISYNQAYKAELWLKKQKDRKIIVKILSRGKIIKEF